MNPDAKIVLVTGGSGFIGAHLSRQLLLEGHTLICLDDMSTGRIDMIQDLMGHPRFYFVQRDVREDRPLPEDFPPPRMIYHLACPASPCWFRKDPIRTLSVNFNGTMNVLKMARRYKSRVFIASSSEVYGDPSSHPQPEDYSGNVSPLGERSCYSEGKRCAESLAAAYIRHYGMDIHIGRLFNTYGPGVRPDDGRVVGTFILAALQDKPLTVHGDGSQTRSFCYIDDLVRALQQIMVIPAAGEPKALNLGNPAEMAMRDLGALIIELTGSASEIRFLESRSEDPRRRSPDISRATELLDWTPRISLREGLHHTITWFQHMMDEGRFSDGRFSDSDSC